jgi:gluconokinase
MSEKLPRSPYDAIDGLVYFPRMLEKIRLHVAGELPPAYLPMLGDGFDGRCVRFLRIKYDDLRERVQAGGTDEEILDWCCRNGHRPTPEEVETWSGFMRKRGWRDESSERIVFRLKEAGLENRSAEAVTMFDFIDIDEGRTPPDFSKWEPKR